VSHYPSRKRRRAALARAKGVHARAKGLLQHLRKTYGWTSLSGETRDAVDRLQTVVERIELELKLSRTVR